MALPDSFWWWLYRGAWWPVKFNCVDKICPSLKLQRNERSDKRVHSSRSSGHSRFLRTLLPLSINWNSFFFFSYCFSLFQTFSAVVRCSLFVSPFACCICANCSASIDRSRLKCQQCIDICGTIDSDTIPKENEEEKELYADVSLLKSACYLFSQYLEAHRFRYGKNAFFLIAHHKNIYECR